MPIELIRTDDGDVSHVAISGTLDVLTASELDPLIDALLEQRRTRVVVDLAGLDHIESSGVAALLKLYKRVRAIGGEVELTNARGQPQATFRLLRLEKFFSV